MFSALMEKKNVSTRAAGAVALALALGLGACGNSYDAESQPHIGGSRFDKLSFADIPRPDNASSKTVRRVDGVDTESLSIGATSPELVLKYYADRLEAAGWEAKTGPEEINGIGAWFGVWTQRGREVVVDARFGDADEAGVVATDYTISMS